jgi:hypothetical protein
LEVQVTAAKNSWKREAFTDGRPIPYQGTFSQPEFEKICEGLIPKVMEDKWFIYFEEPYLFLYRSWTGQRVYRVTLIASNNGASVAEALCVSEVLEKSGRAYEAELLDFLISNLLLGMTKPFPIPVGAKNPGTGLLQHVIAGTGFPQSHPEAATVRRNRWKFWRK